MDKEKLVELCKRLQEGDNSAYEELYVTCYTPLYHFVYGLKGQKEETEDIVHDTFLKLAKAVDSFKEGNVIGWLFTIARNTFYDRLRKFKKVSVSIDSDNSIEETVTYEESFEVLDISNFMKKLKPNERELIVLKYWQGFDSVEISKMVGKSSEAVRKELSRIIKKYK